MLLAYWNSLLGVAIVGLFGVIYKQGPPGNRLAAPEPTLALEGGDNTKNFYNLPVSKMPLRLWDVTSRVLHPLHLDQQHLETTPTNYTVPVPAPPEPAESVKYYVKGKVTMAEWRNVHARGLTLLWAGMALVYGFVGYVNRAASKRKHP